MDRSLVELESIVRNRICKVCTERTVDGQCGLEEPSNCALFRLFPQVAQAIQSVKLCGVMHTSLAANLRKSLTPQLHPLRLAGQ